MGMELNLVASLRVEDRKIHGILRVINHAKVCPRMKANERKQTIQVLTLVISIKLIL